MTAFNIFCAYVLGLFVIVGAYGLWLLINWLVSAIEYYRVGRAEMKRLEEMRSGEIESNAPILYERTFRIRKKERS